MTQQFTVYEAAEYAKANPGSIFLDREGDEWIFIAHIGSIRCFAPQDLEPYDFAPFTLLSTAEEPSCSDIPNNLETPTLRDQFAMAALTSFGNAIFATEKDVLAMDCYSLADAMLKARGGHADD